MYILNFQLEVRPELIGIHEYILLFLTLVILGVSKLSNENIYQALITSNIKVVNFNAYWRNNLAIRSLPILLLFFLFLAWASYFINYLFFEGDNFGWLVVGTSLLACVVFSFLTFLFLSWLCDNSELKFIFARLRLSELFSSTLFYIIFGIAFLVSKQNLELYKYTFVSTLLFFFGIRLIKIVVLGIYTKIPWYYIILYLCTLEIMPFIVGFYMFTVYSQKQLINF